MRNFSSRVSQFCKSAILVGLITALLVKAVDVGLDIALAYFPPLFPKNSELRARTYDYDVIAGINAFGFRGSNAEFVEGQIIVVGDSFTYGLGVQDDETWPRKLEQRLRLSGDERHVYNLGAPGTDSLFHIQLARESLEMKPQVVILSVLLADDFQQVLEASQRQAASGEADWRALAVASAKDLVKWSLPGSFKLFRLVKYAEEPQEPGDQDSEPRPISESLTDEQFAALQVRAAMFPPALREAVLSGQVNYGLLAFGERYPDRSWAFWNDLAMSHPETLATAQRIEEEMAALAGEMAEYGGRLLVLAMPSGEFVQSEYTSNFRLYGSNIPEASMSTLAPEEGLRQISERAGAAFVPSLEEFRRRNTTELFFPTDGHMNPSGTSIIADVVLDYLLNSVK